MKNNKMLNVGWLALLALLAGVGHAAAQNTVFTYQGGVQDDGTNFSGAGLFKFALVTGGNPPATVWSNDGTSVNGGQPSLSVGVAVTNGLFTVVVGDPALSNMTVLPAAVFTQPNLQLQIWFNDGVNGFTAFPVQNLTPVPYAIYSAIAGSASNLLGNATVNGSLSLPGTATIYSGGVTLLHDDKYFNFFNGQNAGNLTNVGIGTTAIGADALENNVSGSENTAVGADALVNNLSGGQNTAVGSDALSLATGGGNIALGSEAGKNLTVGDDNIYIGNLGQTSESGVVRIGTPGTQSATYLAGTVNCSAISSGAITSSGSISGATISGPTITAVSITGGSITSLGDITGVSIASSGPMTCCSITITGGCDLAEPFLISAVGPPLSEGDVLVIDEANPGRLKLADQPYDTRVAGVLSGANGINAGIQMHQQGLLEGGRNVALTGRVYVRADASNGAIKPGDMLTTSPSPGRAMKVGDYLKARGAILGKAMSGLENGQGMVLVLVTLQ